MSSGLTVVILAAGQGSRMRSQLPKVLHCIGGKPLLGHVLDAAKALFADQIVIVHGHGGEQVQAAFAGDAIQWVEQAEQLGTGHAVAQALPYIADEQQLLVLYGDVPLIPVQQLQGLMDTARDNDLAVLTAWLDEPTGYGRIVRDADDQVSCIVEEKDCDEWQKEIEEVNTGIMCASAKNWKAWVANLSNSNAQSEYYLTDCVALCRQHKGSVAAHITQRAELSFGVNNKQQLAFSERLYQQLLAEELMQAGVTVMDPARLDIRGQLSCGNDVAIDVGVVFEGEVTIGNNVIIEPYCVIKNTVIGDNAHIKAYTHCEDAKIGVDSVVGPYARLRPGAELLGNARVGNFVEIKKSCIGLNSKVNHLSYIGDTQMGANVNVGAGTITCNYDGINKHKTIIGDDVFVGSDTQLIAPVTVGSGATIGAGSTITKDTPDNELTLSRSKQMTIKNWKKPSKS